VSEARTDTVSRSAEVAAFAVLSALGAAVVVSSFGYGILLEGNRIGPGFLPLVIGGLLLLLSGAQLVSRLRTPHPQAAEAPGWLVEATDVHLHPHADEPEETDVLGRTHAYRVRQLRMVVAAVLVAIALVPFSGFLLTFGLLVLFITTYVERCRPLSAVAISLAAVGVVYAVFGLFLNVPLPTGLLDLVIGS
jgi:putative tricarboxylic transport membrane protein